MTNLDIRFKTLIRIDRTFPLTDEPLNEPHLGLERELCARRTSQEASAFFATGKRLSYKRWPAANQGPTAPTLTLLNWFHFAFGLPRLNDASLHVAGGMRSTERRASPCIITNCSSEIMS